MAIRTSFFILASLFLVATSGAQTTGRPESAIFVDSLSTIDTTYREDQFYLGLTYNVLLDKPGSVVSNGLTGGVSFGYLRDMPINKNRNLAIAIGLGVSFDEYGNTLFIGEDTEDETIFAEIDRTEISYDKNRFSTASLEVPIEFRWRSSSVQPSTPESYRFWRIYAGLRLGYAYWYKASFKQTDNNVTQTDIPEFDKVRIGATCSIGYNSVNFYAYYGLNPFFTDAITTQGDRVDLRTLKLGLLFYFL